jgi:nicotinate-nucleotide pyrophosphorylase (carboxylating)
VAINSDCEFRQVDWSPTVEQACRTLVRLAVAEDLSDQEDWTTVALVPIDRRGQAKLVAREGGVAAGLAAVPCLLEGTEVKWQPHAHDSDRVQPGETLGFLAGPARQILTFERVLLNFVGHLSGIATLTHRFVALVSGTSARIYDTRKTTPAWRLPEKYAVRCGGGHNHRSGLFDAILIKDNHLALAASGGMTPAEAVRRARDFLRSQSILSVDIVEVEVDTLAQLQHVLTAAPDIVLLDNMQPHVLAEAVALRNKLAPHVLLEASGGVRLDTVREIAATGIDRISIGALTHSAQTLDVALDWQC